MLPLFLLRREKYASGFRQRLGGDPKFEQDGRPVIWRHCVSVGETNAARPLVDELISAFPDHRLVVSTTTKTGQNLARSIFKDKATAIAYFPFDWKFSVRKALENYKPSLILLMETEIWPRFIREAKASGAKVAIVNGRLSERSVDRYAMARTFVGSVLADVDLALMQNEKDAERIVTLGIDPSKVMVTGNLKFDHAVEKHEDAFTGYLRKRFAIDGVRPLVLAASTHDTEEEQVLRALRSTGKPFRLLIAPRHPARFDAVANLMEQSNYSVARRSTSAAENDSSADVIVLDSIGELRAAYPLADIVFVGGSLIPHGGQSVLEPAAAGKAMITGPHTYNFDAVVKEFLSRDALIQTGADEGNENERDLADAFGGLLEEPEKRRMLGENALAVMSANRGATARAIENLKSLTANSGAAQPDSDSA
jgi:3-deoxy-D-manno-octulosonic-acid transferase